MHSSFLAAPALTFSVTAILGAQNVQQQRYIADMKSDLRNLVIAEEAYFADSVKYTDNIIRFTLTPGVRGLVIHLTADGWNARGRPRRHGNGVRNLHRIHSSLACGTGGGAEM